MKKHPVMSGMLSHTLRDKAFKMGAKMLKKKRAYLTRDPSWGPWLGFTVEAYYSIMEKRDPSNWKAHAAGKKIVERGDTCAVHMNCAYVVKQTRYHDTLLGPVAALQIMRHSQTDPPNHWRTLQQIKDDLFGEEFTAVEVYPMRKHLEGKDAPGVYYLWVFKEGEFLPFGLHCKPTWWQNEK